MKKIISILVLFTALTIQINAQWFYQNPIPTNTTLHSVKFFQGTGWCVGNFGTILKTTDSGMTWVSQSSGTNSYLYGVSFFDQNNGIVVGSAGGPKGIILRTTDRGTSWVTQLRDSISWLYNVSFIDENIGIAVGYQGTILRTLDGGVTWSDISYPTTNTLQSVFFSDQQNGIIVGDYGMLLRTTDGGNNWIQLNSGTNSCLLDLTFTDINTGFIVGCDGIMLKTTNGGASWVLNVIDVLSDLFGVSFADSINGIATGAGVYGGNVIYRTSDGGIIWHAQSSGTSSYLRSVYYQDLMNSVIVGDRGTILKTTDGGITWANQNRRVPAISLEGVDFYDINNGIAIGYGTILKTTNSGTDWIVKESNTTKRLLDVEYIDQNNVVVVGENETILRSTDKGNTWLSQSPGTTFTYKKVNFFNQNIGWIFGDFYDGVYHGSILRTSDSGLNWDRLVNSSIDSISDCIFFDESNALGIHYSGKIFKTTDAGITWSSEIINQSYIFRNLIKDEKVIINVNYSFLLVSSDRGSSWEVQPNIGYGNTKSISFSDSTNGIAVGSYVIYRTTDAGISWNEQKRFDAGLNDVCYLDVNNAWVVGSDPSGGIILKTTNGGVTFIEEQNNISHPVSYLLNQNYPNPFNPSTKISWQSPVGGWLTLKVYDVLGKEVATLVNEYRPAGIYEVEFSRNNLVSGIYFYRLQAGDYVETKKMILLK